MTQVFRSTLRSREPYIPNGMGEIWDHLGAMFLQAPRFLDGTGYFPEQNIDTEFHALNEGLKTIRKRVGDENYAQMVALSGEMRAHFESDPEDNSPGTLKGRECIHRMENILKAAVRRKKSAS